MSLPEKCDVCGGTLDEPCKHILGQPRRLANWLDLAIQKLAEHEILWDGRQFSFSPAYLQGFERGFREGQKRTDTKPIGHHRWSHDGPCEEGCYYETFD